MSPATEKKYFECWPTFLTHQGDRVDLGFTCGEGWREIMLDLFFELERLIAIASVDEPFKILQVKQRFGELRVAARSGGGWG